VLLAVAWYAQADKVLDFIVTAERQGENVVDFEPDFTSLAFLASHPITDKNEAANVTPVATTRRTSALLRAKAVSA